MKRRILTGALLAVLLLPAPALASRERNRCYDGYDCGRDDDGDCDWRGDCGDNSYRNEYGRGRNGDQGRAGRDQCHSFCNNVIIIPDPTKKDQPPEEER